MITPSTPIAELRPGLRLISAAELLQLPDPNWLVAGLLEERRFGVLFGQPGSGKTFVAASMAFAVSAGLEWHGRRVEQGPILYVAAEGQAGISKRTEAWLRHHEVVASDFTGVHFLLEAIDLRDPSRIEAVVRAVTEHGIKLVVFDTLAHCAPGVDENSVKDMQEVVRGIQRITAAGAAVLAVHHSTKADGTRERGSGALRAAADVMLAVAGSQDVVVLHNNKQKDEEQASDLVFQLQRMELRRNPQGIPVTSCVLVPGDEVPTSGGAGAADNAAARRIVGALQDEPAGLSSTALLKRTGLPESTFNAARKALASAGRIAKTSGHRGVWQVVEAPPGPSPEDYPEPLEPAA